MKQQFNEPVFYVPGRPGIIDVARIDSEGVARGLYSDETAEQMQARYPGATLGELATIAADSENQFKSAPARISAERFNDMLNILPPVAWVREGGAESFKISERTYGNITSIFARIGEQYFELADSIRMPHAHIIQGILKAFPKT